MISEIGDARTDPPISGRFGSRDGIVRLGITVGDCRREAGVDGSSLRCPYLRFCPGVGVGAGNHSSKMSPKSLKSSGAGGPMGP